MINEHHSRLAEAKIKYLLRSGSWRVKGRERMGNAEKCSSKHKHLTGYDFIVTINKLFWDKMNVKERKALVDHELCHCGKSDNGWCIWPHDLEDFIGIVRGMGSGRRK